MEKHTERQPIDDLFARKLGDMSLTPSSDAFERLQARMGQKKPEAKIVFWRNSAIQGYVAAAACLLLVCLFGWLYWPSSDSTKQDTNQIASNKQVNGQIRKPLPTDTADGKGAPVESGDSRAEQTKQLVARETSNPEPLEQLAQNQPVSTSRTKTNRNTRVVTSVERTVGKSGNRTDEPVLAQAKTDENKQKVGGVVTTNNKPTQPTVTEQTAVAAVKPAPVMERGLVVTIAEPEALAAARQAVKASVEERAAVAAADRQSEKDNKPGTIWQQVKRFKQGDVFARGDNTDNESGLLGRAYSGLKHSIEKDKSAKE